MTTVVQSQNVFIFHAPHFYYLLPNSELSAGVVVPFEYTQWSTSPGHLGRLCFYTFAIVIKIYFMQFSLAGRETPKDLRVRLKGAYFSIPWQIVLISRKCFDRFAVPKRFPLKFFL
jgi:hypothetical protein